MPLPRPPEALKPWLPVLAGAVVVALLAGVVIGRLLPGAPAGSGSAATESAGGGHSHGGGAESETGAADLGGLSLSASGYTLVPADTRVDATSGPEPWRFTVTDTAGDPVTKFATVHGEKLHLFAVRRDFTGYQHLHPTMAKDGRWSADIDFGSPGGWRVIADFAVGAGKDVTPVTLGTDVTVPGDYDPEPLPEPAGTDSTGGFAARLEFDPELGASSPALIEVTRDGEPVALEPYLGARGHLVLLRAGDLGFAHVHPDAEPVDGKLRFWATLPSKGSYRAFLDFKVDGEVHTAAFTVKA